MRAARSIQDIDCYVAKRIKARRIESGITQQQMADVLGVSLQQYAKYENGANRITATRLYQLGCALGCPVDWFFIGVDDGDAEALRSIEHGRTVLDLARHFLAASPVEQRAISEAARILANGEAA